MIEVDERVEWRPAGRATGYLAVLALALLAALAVLLVGYVAYMGIRYPPPDVPSADIVLPAPEGAVLLENEGVAGSGGMEHAEGRPSKRSLAFTSETLSLEAVGDAWVDDLVAQGWAIESDTAEPAWWGTAEFDGKYSLSMAVRQAREFDGHPESVANGELYLDVLIESYE